jgi:hypothetical protein
MSDAVGVALYMVDGQTVVRQTLHQKIDALPKPAGRKETTEKYT